MDKWVCNPEGANGPALEHHTFAHLDMNLGPIKKSGHFVMAKFLNPEKTTLAITGFQVLRDIDHKVIMIYDMADIRFPQDTPSTPPGTFSTPTTTSRAPGGPCWRTAGSMRESF